MSTEATKPSMTTDPLKRRVTGAVVLVGFAVLLLSLLLRGGGDPVIEEPDDGPQLVVVGAAPPMSQRVSPAQETPRSEPTQPEPSGDTGDATGSSSGTESPRDDSRQASRTPVTSAVGQSAEPEAPRQPPTSSTASRSATSPASARSEQPAPRRAPPAAEPSDAPDGWYVQVGVFGSQSNANGLAKTLTDRTYTTRVDPVQVNGKRLFRVMVGPYPSKAQAERRQPWLKRAIDESGRVLQFP